MLDEYSTPAGVEFRFIQFFYRYTNPPDLKKVLRSCNLRGKDVGVPNAANDPSVRQALILKIQVIIPRKGFEISGKGILFLNYQFGNYRFVNSVP